MDLIQWIIYEIWHLFGSCRNSKL